MDGLSAAASLIAVLQVTSSIITICYTYRQGQKHSSREVIQLSDELSSLKNVLDALLRLVERSTDDPAQLATFDLLTKPDGPLLTCQAELERLKAQLEPEVGWRAIKRTLVWPLKEGELRKALGVLERLKGTMQLALSADQAAISLVIRDDVADLTILFQKHSLDHTYGEILKWLAAPNPHSNHVASRKKRQPESGEWFLNSKRYGRWLHGSETFLWLYGIPGSGKTVLCSTIIDQLAGHCQGMPKTVVAYFYFDFNHVEQWDFAALIRSLVTQLAAQAAQVPGPLLDLYQNHQNGRKPVNELDLVTVLRNLILSFHNVYIVLDALDESFNCEDVLNFIKETREWNISRLHFLITSRQWAKIEESLDGVTTERICLNETRLNTDIAVYITDQLAKDKTLTKWPSEIRKHIQDVLMAEEDGMFRWVVCQLDMLKRCMSIAAVKKALTSLPRNLYETYDRILLEIDDFYQIEVVKTLQALIATLEPLILEEIVEVLAIDLESNPAKFDPDLRLLDPRSILSMCSSLVALSPETRSNPSFINAIHAPNVLALKLAHASVADYLTQSRTSSRFHFSIHSARQLLAKACLAYLLNPQFSNGYERSKISGFLQDFPFLSHAIRFWPKYLDRSDEKGVEDIEIGTKQLLQAFFATSKLARGGNFAFWVGMVIPTSSEDYILNTHPLYYAASYGLTAVVRIILESELVVDIDQLGGRAHSSALHVAVYRKHMDVVKLLLENGADPNLPNDKNESPLYWATQNPEITDLLIKFGATVDARSNDDNSSTERRAIMIPENANHGPVVTYSTLKDL